jgi:hypothetical protein
MEQVIMKVRAWGAMLHLIPTSIDSLSVQLLHPTFIEESAGLHGKCGW